MTRRLKSNSLKETQDTSVRYSQILCGRCVRLLWRQIKIFQMGYEEFLLTVDHSVFRIDSALEEKLREAILRGEIWPSFQPLVELKSEAIIGFEVLARWTTSQQEAVAPSVFIPLAEKCGLLDLLTQNLVRDACLQAREWAGDFILAINLSPGQFRDVDLNQKIQKTIRSTDFPFERVHIEITEGALLGNDKSVQSNISALKSVGMGIALDDFGTGFANLTQLHMFPFDKLKIDMSFVRNITSDSCSRKIVASTIALGQSLGMTVVAEGVETREQAAMLRRLGCNIGQGWLFGKAVCAAQASDIITHHRQTSLARNHYTAPSFQRAHELETLYKSAPVGFCFLDDELVYARVNARFASMFNLSPEDMIGRTSDTFMPAMEAACVTADLKRVLAGETIIKHAYKPLNSDRSFYVVNHRVDDDDGRAIGISVTSIDVTVLRQSGSVLS